MLEPSSYRRLAALAGLVAVVVASLQYRLYDIQVRRHRELSKKADRCLKTKRVAEPWRGEIRSSEGEVLAMDVPTMDLWADLSLCAGRVDEVAAVVAPLLKTNVRSLALRLEPLLIGFRSDDRPLYRQAVLLQRHLTPAEWERMRAVLTNATFGVNPASEAWSEKRLLDRLRRRVLFVQDNHRRFYPFGEMLSPVLGFVGTTRKQALEQGQAGLERSMQGVLMGVSGAVRSDRTAGGLELPWRRSECRDAVDGQHVVLTLHAALQRIVEEALEDILSRHAPRSASILIVRPRTGEILAWGAIPRYDPQCPGRSGPETWRNRALSAMVEPGSTFKLITLAAALNEHLVTLEDLVFCENGALHYRAPIPGRASFRTLILHDYKPFGWLTVEEVFAKSSNIGVAKLALRLGPDRLYDYIKRFGFGTLTGIPLPDEMPGWISPHTNWPGGPMLYVPMGQGIAVTQLQLTMAYAAVANDGLLMRPLLIRRIESAFGQVLVECRPEPVRQVIDPETARLVREALKKVVTRQGTGAAAASRLVSVGGKTGTAQKADGTGYLPGCFYATFVGLVPGDNPELCISVALDEPQHGHQGGVVAAPAFKVVAEAAAGLLQML